MIEPISPEDFDSLQILNLMQISESLEVDETTKYLTAVVATICAKINEIVSKVNELEERLDADY